MPDIETEVLITGAGPVGRRSSGSISMPHGAVIVAAGHRIAVHHMKQEQIL